MKKFLSLIVLLVAFTSCEDDVKFNNPAVQATKNGELWRAKQFSATYSTSTHVFTLTATGDFDILTFNTSDAQPDPASYTLGIAGNNAAAYSITIDGTSQTYATGTGDTGTGRVTFNSDITNNNPAAGFASGKFYFTGTSADSTDDADHYVYFTEGNFYKVPVTVVP